MKTSPQQKLAAEVNAGGFVFLQSYLPKKSTRDIIAKFGTIEKLAGLDEIQELTPKNASDSPPNIYSGIFGCDKFPFHTDLAHWYLPPRFFVLRCIEGASEVKTHLLDSVKIIQSVGSENLRGTLVQPGRPIEGNRCLLRILDQNSRDGSLFRWDSLFIIPSTNHSLQMCLAIKETIANTKPRDIVLERPGDTLIVDNWRMLHGRSAVPAGQRHRKINRVYVSSLL